jgi:hypothetical protein
VWPLSHIPKAARRPAVHVTTPLTTRAAELKRLYDALGLGGLCLAAVNAAASLYWSLVMRVRRAGLA